MLRFPALLNHSFGGTAPQPPRGRELEAEPSVLMGASGSKEDSAAGATTCPVPESARAAQYNVYNQRTDGQVNDHRREHLNPADGNELYLLDWPP